MRYFKYILFLLLIAIIGTSIYIAVQPNDFKVSSERNIKAPASVVYEILSDTIANDRSAFWKSGNLMKNSAQDPPISIEQTFTGKDIQNSVLAWNVAPNGDGTTKVTRTLAVDKLSFLFKAKAIFGQDLEKTLNHQFEEDLKTLENDVIENMSAYSINIEGITEYGGGFYMYKTTSSTASNINNTSARQFAEIFNFMHDHNIDRVGHPFNIYHQIEASGNVIMSNAVPVQNKVTVAAESNILCGFMDRTPVAKATLKGNYSNLKEAWNSIQKYVTDNGYERSDVDPFEIFTNDPGNVPNPARWTTDIYIPIKAKPAGTEQQ
ncbi:MAG TPA: GyrI-like domain-containing protein [Aquaticitalea sp.]|nr:GyrI-like domain-containing protein [Aquaticitalea sp.]HNU58550.1 GyrI-like domain-containing protein [Aquaticitalea sp.]